MRIEPINVLLFQGVGDRGMQRAVISREFSFLSGYGFYMSYLTGIPIVAANMRDKLIKIHHAGRAFEFQRERGKEVKNKEGKL